MSYKDKFSRPNYKAPDHFAVRDLENQFPINTLYAALSLDEKGNEGILSMSDGDSHMPLVFGDEAKIGLIKELCAELKNKTKKRLRIVKFTHKEIIEELSPDQKLDTTGPTP